jgi:hypothetical protein
METILLVLALLFGSATTPPPHTMSDPCSGDPCIVQTGPGTGG